MRPRGSFQLATLRGVPIYVHFSLPMVGAVLSFMEFRPWAILGVAIILLLHELGHTVLLRHYDLPVLGVQVHLVGAEVYTNDWATPWQRAVVAWGGVLAQALVFIVLGGLARLKLVSYEVRSHDLYSTLVGTNMLLAAVNLIPLGTLDGVEAWKLPRFMYLRGKGAYYEGRLQALEAAKKRLEAEDDDAPPPPDQLH